jgi:hypothetical protein
MIRTTGNISGKGFRASVPPSVSPKSLFIQFSIGGMELQNKI